jgi:hypothetical protein
MLGLETQLDSGTGMEDTQDDVIGFCSGAFPASQMRHAAVTASSDPSRAETSDAMTNDSSSDEEDGRGGVEGEGGVLMRWVQRHQKPSQQDNDSMMSKPAVGMVGGWADESNSEMGGDEDMPFIRRRKVKVRQTNG